MARYTNDRDEIILSQEAIRSCNNNSHFEAGDVIVKEAQQTYQRFFQTFPLHDGYDEGQAQYLLQRAEKWKNLVTDVFNAQAKRRGQFVPISVAGPARYDSKKQEKILDGIQSNRMEESEKLVRFIENTKTNLVRLRPLAVTLEGLRNGKYHKEIIQSDDPDAILKLEAKLESLKGLQEKMKAWNAHWRKYSTMAGYGELTPEQVFRLDIAFKEDYEQRPYPSYCLSNNNSNIKAISLRIEKLKEKQASEDFEPILFSDGEVVGNKEVDRLQFLFEEKPDEETRTLLKSNGFRWSPKHSAWQRQWTDNGERAVKKVLTALSEGG